MARFAKMTSDGVTVLAVHVVNDADTTNDDGDETEAQGIKFLKKIHGWDYWRKCSYNTRGGVHILEGTPYRKNHPGKGCTYDEDKDAFIFPKPFPSWTLNNDTCLWEPPIAKPDDYGEVVYHWNESDQSWTNVG